MRIPRGTSISPSILQGGLFILIAGLGLFLRLWNLGGKAFWMDELGVANAVLQPTLPRALAAANDHIMAMPLDYVVGWVMARLSQGDAWLRLPEALWGFLTLLVGYRFSLELSGNKRIALFAMLLMAVSPILVQYSQELRFYAPLTFFFTLSLYLGLRAVRRSSPQDWLLFALVTLAGLFFHFYLILVPGIVLLWLVTYFGKAGWELRRNWFGASAISLSLAFLIGLKRFGGVFAEHKLPPFLFESFQNFLLSGLGWIPPFPIPPAGFLLPALLFLLALCGVIALVRRDPLSPSSLLFYGAIALVVTVIGLDLLKNYPLFDRQLIMLVPIVLFLTACGAEWIVEKLSAPQRFVLGPTQAAALVALVLIFASMPVLQSYYQLRKGSEREILLFLGARWRSQEPILVEPGTLEVYAHYWRRMSGNPSFVDALARLDYSSRDRWHYPDPAWAITDYPARPDIDAALRAADFIPVYLPPENVLHAQMLWRRDGKGLVCPGRLSVKGRPPMLGEGKRQTRPLTLVCEAQAPCRRAIIR